MSSVAAVDLAQPLRRYADRFHSVANPGHHVGSPLGAWILLALCGPCATGTQREELASVLGMGIDAAAALAKTLLATPHKAVGAAAAIWTNRELQSRRWSEYLTTLPEAIGRGDMPSQGDLDVWARKHTFGLIKTFPVIVEPLTMVLLATALATKVSWEAPFRIAPASELGATSDWSRRLTRVLRSPSDESHQQFIAATDRAGDVVVHAARATTGLLVVSVIAAPDVARSVLLSTAYELATQLAFHEAPNKRSLFDLPLGEGPMWTITEHKELTIGDEDRIERLSTTLPAWSAESDIQLNQPELGFGVAAQALADFVGVPFIGFQAKQVAAARYTRAGFEAAAVTGLGVTGAGRMPPTRPVLVRVAKLRFAHAYAVVAVALEGPKWDYESRAPRDGLWNGIPVFSAWVAEPAEADEDGVDEEADEADYHEELQKFLASRDKENGSPDARVPVRLWRKLVPLAVILLAILVLLSLGR